MKSLIPPRFKADYVVVLVLLLAIVGVGISVYQLQHIFLSENQRSRELLQDRRTYIERAARQLFLETLDQQMKAAVESMKSALDKPYKPVSGMYWYNNQQQVLPLQWNFSHLPDDNVIKHYREIRQQLEQTSPQVTWHEDEMLLWQFVQALNSGDERQIETLAREVMSYDANHRFASRHELVYRLVFVELLTSYTKASRDLLAKLLREDLIDDRGSILPALQKEIIWRRNDLSREEFEFFCNKVIRLSQAQQVRVDDFEEVIIPRSDGFDKPDPQDLVMPSLWREAWYYFPGQTDIYGIAIDLPAIQQSLTSILKAQQWLEPEDSIDVIRPDQELVRLEQIKFSWESQSFQENLIELQSFYQLKVIILLASALSLVAAGFLIWLLYRRQARWVGIKSEFVATVAHEMRTPLSSIRLMAERLADTLATEPKAKDYPQRILSDIDTLSFLSENILSFERLQSGQWIAHTSPMTMAEIVEDLQKELPLFVKIPFCLTHQGDDNSTLYGDPALIKLLFLNLGKNSCAYNSNLEADIQIKWRDTDKGLVVDFIDNGVGIDEEEWQECFMPFYRGKSQRHTRGSGLGLALCQKILHLHGGTIAIADSSERGTHFVLLFKSQKV